MVSNEDGQKFLFGGQVPSQDPEETRRLSAQELVRAMDPSGKKQKPDRGKTPRVRQRKGPGPAPEVLARARPVFSPVELEVAPPPPPIIPKAEAAPARKRILKIEDIFDKVKPENAPDNFAACQSLGEITAILERKIINGEDLRNSQVVSMTPDLIKKSVTDFLNYCIDPSSEEPITPSNENFDEIASIHLRQLAGITRSEGLYDSIVAILKRDWEELINPGKKTEIVKTEDNLFDDVNSINELLLKIKTVNLRTRDNKLLDKKVLKQQVEIVYNSILKYGDEVVNNLSQNEQSLINWARDNGVTSRYRLPQTILRLALAERQKGSR